MQPLEVGMIAPAFAAFDQSGNTVSLEDLRGKKVVLYFYPKDDTPGCTKESCAFRDLRGEFADAGAVIYGVSKDSAHSHQKFADKYGLNLSLLVDTEGEICEAYGVLKEKNMYGRISIGIERTTFIIDEQGNIARIFPKVKVDGHVDEVLVAVKSM